MGIDLVALRAAREAGGSVRRLAIEHGVSEATICFYLKLNADWFPVPPLRRPRVNFKRGAEFNLSKQDVKLLGLVSCGSSNDEIAKELPMSSARVAWRLRFLYPSIGAVDRASAMRRCYELGILLAPLDDDEPVNGEVVPSPQHTPTDEHTNIGLIGPCR